MFNFKLAVASGTSCMFASLLAAPSPEWDRGRWARFSCRVARKLISPNSSTVAAMLAWPYLMKPTAAQWSGTLGCGVVYPQAGRAFPFFSPLMGGYGVFLTGSDTSSNALFGNLQWSGAGRLGLDSVLIAGRRARWAAWMGKDDMQRCRGTIAVAAAARRRESSVAEQSKLFPLAP